MKHLLDDRETVSSLVQPHDQTPRVIDLRGLRCPLPVLKIRKALSALAADESLQALTDDPLAPIDVPNDLRETGRDVVMERNGTQTLFRIGPAQAHDAPTVQASDSENPR